jgi:hypothetical protein
MHGSLILSYSVIGLDNFQALKYPRICQILGTPPNYITNLRSYYYSTLASVVIGCEKL